MNEEIVYNPIISQLKILKQKLNQKNKIIKILTESIKTQQKALHTIVSQFQQHESKIMRRLHKLEQINLRYINDYLEVKKQQRPEDFVSINHMFAIDAKSFTTKKIESIKAVQKQQKVINAQAQGKRMVDNCLRLMKDYLTDRKINYQECVAVLSQQRKTKMKQSKRLEAYKQNKQQAKFIEELNKKIKDFDKKSTSIDDKNAVEIFHRRQQIQINILRLDPSKGQITIKDSQIQQKMFQQIIQQILTTNDSQQIQNLFLDGSFNFIQDQVQNLSEIHGVQFVNQNIQSIKKMFTQQKASIINNNYNKSKKDIKFIDGVPSQTEIKRQEQAKYYKKAQQLEENTAGTKNFIKIKTRRQRGGQQIGQEEQIQDEQQNQDFNINQISKHRQNKQKKKNSNLDNKLQKTLAKSFFEEQDKKRDELIDRQKEQIVQHSKVIDKLITFIKKQFKQRKLDDIDADDPQQLIGYYFKVNEKKYGDIREQMKEVQTLQKETAKTNSELTFINEELNIKVNELQVQMEQLFKKYESSSFQLHILISKTQDLVKISLQTLINSCMKNLTPEELINQLERIIELIKQNVQNKRNMIYKFTVQSEIIENNQEKILRKEFISVNKDNYSAITEQLQEFKGIQQDKKVRNQNQNYKIEPLKQKSQKNLQVFIPQWKKLQYVEPSQIQQPQLLKIQSNIRQSGQESFEKSQGFDQKYINQIKQKIEIIKDQNFNNQDYDMNEMYSKYKQALMCLQRAQNINRQHQIKYQQFIGGLKKSRAWECPQKLQQKLFYMQKLIAEQNQLLQNQREEYEQTILTQVQQSEILAQNIIKKFKLTKKKSNK